MSYLKVSLYSDDLMTLKERKKHIESMYGERRNYTQKKINIGFIHKFNNSIGFKPVVGHDDNYGRYYRPEVESPEDYLSPKDILFKNMRTPLDSFELLVFYIPDKEITHTIEKFTYNGSDIACKWESFLKKVFPKLKVKTNRIEEIPKQSLRDFTLEYFFRNLNNTLNYTIEFSSDELLSNEDLDYIVPKIQQFSNDTITVAQFPCKACVANTNGEKNYHIEVVYLTWYGKDRIEKTYDEYQDRIYKIKNT